MARIHKAYIWFYIYKKTENVKSIKGAARKVFKILFLGSKFRIFSTLLFSPFSPADVKCAPHQLFSSPSLFDQAIKPLKRKKPSFPMQSSHISSSIIPRSLNTAASDRGTSRQRVKFISNSCDDNRHRPSGHRHETLPAPFLPHTDNSSCSSF